MGLSLKVGSKHLDFHERVTSLIPYMEIRPDRLSSLTRGFQVPLIVINVTTDIRLEYIAIDIEPTKIYDKKGEKLKIISPVRKNRFNNWTKSHHI